MKCSFKKKYPKISKHSCDCGWTVIAYFVKEQEETVWDYMRWKRQELQKVVFCGGNEHTNLCSLVLEKHSSQFRLSVTRWRNTTTLEKCKMHFVCRETDRERNWGDIVWQWHTCLLLYFSLSLFSCFIELEHSIGKAKQSWKSFCYGHFRHLLNLPLAQVKSKCWIFCRKIFRL